MNKYITAMDLIVTFTVLIQFSLILKLKTN